MSLKGKHVIVTGGGSGIGKCLVKELLGNGWHVHTCDINPDGLIALEAECNTTRRTDADNNNSGGGGGGGGNRGVRLTTHVCDITDEVACIQMVTTVISAAKKCGAPLAALANVAASTPARSAFMICSRNVGKSSRERVMQC